MCSLEASRALEQCILEEIRKVMWSKEMFEDSVDDNLDLSVTGATVKRLILYL